MAVDPELGLSEREEARERLRASIDALTERASLQVQMEKEPLKMLGGASAVGALLGMVIGRQFRRSRKIYVDAASPVKHQKALVKAQTNKSGSTVGGALVATLGTLAIKTLTEKIITPRLEGYASGLLERSGGAPAAGKSAGKSQASSTPGSSPAAAFEVSRPASAALSPARASDTASMPAGRAPVSPAAASAAPASSIPVSSIPASTASAPHAGVLPHPPSQVEAKAEGSAIDPEQMTNPNRR